MRVRVDEAGHDRPPVPVLAEIDFLARLLAALENLDDLAVVADHHRRETLHRAVALEGDAVDIVDQRIGEGGGGDER